VIASGFLPAAQNGLPRSASDLVVRLLSWQKSQVGRQAQSPPILLPAVGDMPMRIAIQQFIQSNYQFIELLRISFRRDLLAEKLHLLALF